MLVGRADERLRRTLTFSEDDAAGVASERDDDERDSDGEDEAGEETGKEESEDGDAAFDSDGFVDNNAG